MLNIHLPEKYYAQLGAREEIGIVGEDSYRRIVPDVAIDRTPGLAEEGGVATMCDVGESVEVQVSVESLDPEEVSFVEIRDAGSDHEVVTILEILSPCNKLHGRDQGKYVSKRHEVLNSDTSLIEIDLLRTGDRSLFGPDIERKLATFREPPDYLVLINRAWNRRCFQLFPAYLPKSLPPFPVPLREGEPELTFDLQTAVNQTYVRGPYARGAVDYSAPADPPIDERRREWVSARLSGASRTAAE
jgi:hypothetical protein